MNKIYIVIVSNSYGDFGDSYNHSYHKSEEGAYLELDRLAKKENLIDYIQTGFDGSYWYTNSGRYLDIQTQELED
jgi:hypothetical protein